MAEKVKKVPIKLLYKDWKQKLIPSFQMFQIDCDWFTMFEKNCEIMTFQVIPTDFKIRLFVHRAWRNFWNFIFPTGLNWRQKI